MIAKARKAHPAWEWVQADLTAYRGGPFDLVFSNAVLQWLPGHAQLLPKLMDLVAPGGFLAVQVPSQARFPVREAMEAVARSARFRSVLEGAGGSLTFHDPRFYYEHLSGLARNLDLWVSTYFHVLDSHQGMIDWMESTGMRPYLERLDPEGQAAFKAAVLECCEATFPACGDGKVLMPFERLFFVAEKAEAVT
jgi:trans-aconitate 2-methyltransferase